MRILLSLGFVYIVGELLSCEVCARTITRRSVGMTTARHDIDPRYQEPRRRRSHTLGETAVAGHVAGALVASGVGGVRRDGIRSYDTLRVIIEMSASARNGRVEHGHEERRSGRGAPHAVQLLE